MVKKNPFSILGKRQETKIIKFDSHPYTLNLQCPSYSKFSQLLYESSCSQELWREEYASWHWNKYVLFYTNIQRYTAAAGTNYYKTM